MLLDTLPSSTLLDDLPSLTGLSEKSSKTLELLSDELKDTIAKRQIFRTETEMRVSVLNDNSFPTVASKYWQCVREQSVMIEQAALMSLEYRRNEVRMKRELRNMESDDELDREAAQIEIDSCLMARRNLERDIEDRVREIRLWSQIKEELDDGSFDTVDVNVHQLVSYSVEFAMALATANVQQFSGEEYKTLVGKLNTCIARAKEVNAFDQIVARLPTQVVTALLSNPT